MRGRFQGVGNIIRFNWPFYAIAWVAVCILAALAFYLEVPVNAITAVILVIVVALTTISLVVSWYVYDLSGFYSLEWLDDIAPRKIVNINAGFDETSELLSARFPNATLTVYDFYDPTLHTEPSIQRARKAYGQFPGTKHIATDNVAIERGSADTILLIMAAHEIRNNKERGKFLAELARVLEMDGRIVVVEHLRDAANMVAYNIGALHFHSLRTWEHTFEQARLSVERRVRINPFVTAFFLKPNGTAH